VLSVPKRLRYFMQRDGAVLNMVLRIFLGSSRRNVYVNHFLPVLEQRLSLAGFRLAGLLNRVLK
jgi:hypothetical protein